MNGGHDKRGTVLRNGCKINLFLRIGPPRQDGYHELESLFLPLDEPHDSITIVHFAGHGEGIVRTAFLAADRPDTALNDINPEHNTLTRAYTWYAGQTGYAPSLDLRIVKGIPHGGGLGGGSANAAALLLFLQKEAQRAGATPLSHDALLSGCAAIGADVPFFLLDSAAQVSGIGETVRPVRHPFPEFWIVLVCPPLRISTAWAFAALDRMRAENHMIIPGTKKMPQDILTTGGVRATNSLAQAQGFLNDFEDLVFAAFPEISRLYGLLVRSGPELARMSGTGSSLFALYQDRQRAEDAVKMLANENVSVYIQRLPTG